MTWRTVALTAAFIAGATCAHADNPSFGRLGEPLRLNIAITPSQTGSWTGILAYEKKYWERHLPRGSRVELNFALRGPVIAAALRDGRTHIGYTGDLPAVALVASDSAALLVGVAALSQDLCVLLVRRDAPAFAAPADGIRWLAGKRFAVSPGTCQQRVALAAFARERVKPAQILPLGLEVYEVAFREQRIDAVGTNELGAATLIEAGVARRLYSSYVAGEWDAVFIATSAVLARDRPDVVRGWLAAELQAQRFMADPGNADEVIRLVAKHLPAVPERALRRALYGAYPANQGGSPVRRVFPFRFSAQAMGVVHDAHRSAQRLGLVPAGALRSGAIAPDFTEELLRAQRLTSPLGEVRARPDLLPK